MEPSLERLLVVSPHPDDDAIAAGGLMQRARDVRVLVVTDGERNPWPQRYMERRWFLNRDDAARWGALRRREVLCAVRALGYETSSVRFLGFPDSGIASLARRGDTRLREVLAQEIADFRPTLIVSPSAQDLHSDHRASAWYVHRAAPHDAAIVTFVVHGGGDRARIDTTLQLTEPEMQRKRDAIACHESQLLLSRARFLSHAAPAEVFYRAEHDLVRIDSRLARGICAFRHGWEVLFASGVIPSVAREPGGVGGAPDPRPGPSLRSG